MNKEWKLIPTLHRNYMEFYIKGKNPGGNYCPEEFFQILKDKYRKSDLEEALYYIVNGYDAIARPKMIGERILRQSGSFMITNCEVCPRHGCSNQKCMKWDTPECDKDKIPQNIWDRLKNIRVKKFSSRLYRCTYIK